MKRTAIVLIVFLLTSGWAFAQKVEDAQKHPRCKYCGMDRQQFASTRMLIEYDDASVMPACSIHCAAVDLAENIDKTPDRTLVGDFNTKQLIDAETAAWVIGGNKPGVMTSRGKWAFASRADADKFVSENGGTVGSFDDALRATYEDMYKDTKMIRERRKMKRMQQQGPASGQAEPHGQHK